MIGNPDNDALWMQKALAELRLGVREVPGAKHHPRVVYYHTFCRLRAKDDETAWCAAFVCACLELAGINSTRSAAAASFATWGQPCELKRGAIVVFGKSDPDAKGTGHVGFVHRVDGDVVWVLGGNQNNRVSIAPRPISRIVATRWPLV